MGATSSAALAQSVERKALNLVVAGSSPAGGARFFGSAVPLTFCSPHFSMVSFSLVNQGSDMQPWVPPHLVQGYQAQTARKYAPVSCKGYTTLPCSILLIPKEKAEDPSP